MGTKTDPEDRTLTVVVKAKKLYGEAANEDNVDKYTALRPDRGLASEFGVKNKTYETVIAMQHKMTWEIALATPNGEDRGYDVRLTSVTHNPTAGNPNFFDSESLTPGGNPKIIEGTISKNPNLPEKDDSYTINFEISNGTTWIPYPLDPRLRIKQ
jgi:hypothetical protein